MGVEQQHDFEVGCCVPLLIHLSVSEDSEGEIGNFKDMSCLPVQFEVRLMLSVVFGVICASR